MKNCTYKKVVVIGCGTIATTVMEYVIKSSKTYGFSSEFVRYEIGLSSPVKKICQEANAGYLEISDKDELEQYFININQKTLVLSAGNYYLFPETVVSNTNLTIINFHNALLPKYPGINSPSWCIFNGEKETGITWHYVTKGIDSGDIIYQKSYPIGNEVRAIELVARLMDLAQSGLEEFFDSLVTGTNSRYKQEGSRGPMCYSKDIPGEGFFKLDDDPEYIYRLLRSIDLGKSHVFPAARFRHNNKDCVVVKYKKDVYKGYDIHPNWVYIRIDDEDCLRIKYKEL